jgi:hypothetical protein
VVTEADHPLLSDHAWDELRRLVRDNLESEDDPVPIVLAAALLDVDARLRVIEAAPKRTLIEVVQHFEDVDPDRVAKAFIDALERAKGPA